MTQNLWLIKVIRMSARSGMFLTQTQWRRRDAYVTLSIGISEEIKDAKITAEKNEDLKIEANIWKLTKICTIKKMQIATQI